jgi:hypothetical protein
MISTHAMYDNNDESDGEECRGLSNVNQRAANVVDDRGVDIIAELDGLDG